MDKSLTSDNSRMNQINENMNSKQTHKSKLIIHRFIQI